MDALNSEDFKTGIPVDEIIEILEEDAKREQNLADTSSAKLIPVHRAGYKRSMRKEKEYRRARKLYNGRKKSVVILNAVRKSDFSYVKNWPRLHFDWKCSDGIVSKSRLKRHQYLIVSPSNKSYPKNDHKSGKDEPQRTVVGGYSCLLCDISFAVLSDLEKHTVSHGQLHNCVKSTLEAVKFDQQDIQHNYVRQIEKNHSQKLENVCKKSFSNKCAMYRHISEVRDVEKSPNLRKSFKRREPLRYHVKKLHKEQVCITCPITCKQDFEAFEKLQDHVKTKKCEESCFNTNAHEQLKTGGISNNMLKNPLNDSNDLSMENVNEPTVAVSQQKLLQDKFSTCSSNETNACQHPKQEQIQCPFCNMWFSEKYKMYKHIRELHMEKAKLEISEMYDCDKQSSLNMALNKENGSVQVSDSLDSTQSAVAGKGDSGLDTANIPPANTSRMKVMELQEHRLSTGVVSEGVTEQSQETEYFQSRYCKESFAKLIPVSKHIQGSYKEDLKTKGQCGKFECKFCRISFASIQSQFRHFRNVHKKSFCVTCKHDFGTFSKLQDHLQAVHCNEQSAINTPIKIHEHLEDVSFSKKALTHPLDSRNDSRTGFSSVSALHDTQEEQFSWSKSSVEFQCRLCRKLCACQQHVCRHVREVHSKEQVGFSTIVRNCSRCDHSNRNNSKKIHKKPFCDSCKLNFETFDKLHDHVKTIHYVPQSSQNIAVTLTNNEPKNNNQLAINCGGQLNRESKPISKQGRNLCQKCQMSYASSYALERHVQKHIRNNPSVENWLQCELCLCLYPDEKLLREHKILNHRKIYTYLFVARS